MICRTYDIPGAPSSYDEVSQHMALRRRGRSSAHRGENR